MDCCLRDISVAIRTFEEHVRWSTPWVLQAHTRIQDQLCLASLSICLQTSYTQKGIESCNQPIAGAIESQIINSLFKFDHRIHFQQPRWPVPAQLSCYAMEPSDLKVGRYLYWQGSVQHTFEIVKQESQSQLILAQVVDGVASSGVLKRTKDSEWETSVSTEIQWQLQAAGDAVLVQRSDGCSFRAERMMESQEWQEIVSKPVDAGQTLLITAAPGSGKSTLLREWCRGRPDNKILLLAFNKAVVDQLEANFSELPNVTVKTIHSVAYFATSHLHHGKVGDPTKTDLKNFLDCDWSEVDRQQELLRSFCASAATRLPTSKRQKSLWMHLASGKSGWRVPHNAYLKLLHLSPELRDQAFRGYEIVALDEAQDKGCRHM